MLVLTRKAGESVYIGQDISVTIVKVNGRQVRLKIDIELCVHCTKSANNKGN
jgi:carbon storage regulator